MAGIVPQSARCPHQQLQFLSFTSLFRTTHTTSFARTLFTSHYTMQNVALFLAVIATVLSTASASCEQYKNQSTCITSPTKRCIWSNGMCVTATPPSCGQADQAWCDHMEWCHWSDSDEKCMGEGEEMVYGLAVAAIVLLSICVAIALAIVGCCYCLRPRASTTESVVLHQQPAPGAYHPAQQQQVYGTNVQQVPTQGVVVLPEQKCEV